MGARQLAWLGVASLVATGCVLDDNHCGANQVEIKENFEGCICAPNAVPNADGVGCKPCGANEEAKGGACSCLAGFSRTSPMAACMMVMNPAPGSDASVVPDAGPPTGPPAGTRGQGAACSTQADCENFDATFCQTLQAPNQCFVQGCANGTRACASDHECCDFTGIGIALLESTHGFCVETGKCSAPGKVVKP